MSERVVVRQQHDTHHSEAVDERVGAAVRRRAPFRHRLTAAVATCALTALALVLAPATAGAATDVYKERFRGVVLDGSTSVDDSCTSTSTRVVADATRVLYVRVIRDGCTGEISGVFGEAPPTVFDARGNLATARVVATIPLVDLLTGSPAGEIVVDDTWTATGRAAKSKSTFRTNLPGELLYSQSSIGSTAPATVTGTVPLESGSLWEYNTMVITITHL